MKTVIDNNLRVYQVIDSIGHKYFCNIEDLNRIVIDNNMRSGYFKIYHFWNNKAEKLSQNNLKQMFEVSQLVQNFKYSSK